MDYRLLAKRLEKNAKKYSIKLPSDYKEERHQLPPFPITELRGSDIVIIWEDNSEQIWDNDNDKYNAVEVAKEIELELRAIKYVKLKLIQSISNLEEDLREFNIPEEHIGDVIYTAYSSINNLFIEMDDSRLNKKNLK